jgi:hypothetical protein
MGSVTALGTRYTLRDARLATITRQELLGLAHYVEQGVGGAAGWRAALLWRAGVGIVSRRLKDGQGYTQRALMDAMAACGALESQGTGRTGFSDDVMGFLSLPQEAGAPTGLALSHAIARLLFPEVAETLNETEAERAVERERWVVVRMAYPGIASEDLQGPVANLILKGRPWQEAFMAMLAERAGVGTLPTFLLDIYRHWSPSPSDIREVLPRLAALGPSSVPRTDTQWRACREGAAADRDPALARTLAIALTQ